MKRAELKKAFETKYWDQICTISKEMVVDTGVARDILIANARNRNKELENEAYYYRFTGDENLDYEELDKEIVVLEENYIIPRVF